MKIEANPSPKELKWLILVIAISLGLGHEELMIMVGL